MIDMLGGRGGLGSAWSVAMMDGRRGRLDRSMDRSIEGSVRVLVRAARGSVGICRELVSEQARERRYAFVGPLGRVG